MQIRNPEDLQRAIDLYPESDVILNIGKYIWYNYYCNLHIKADSDEDKENDRIYKQLKINNPEVYLIIEEWVDYEIEKLKL